MTLSWVAEYSDGRIIRESDKQVDYYHLDRTQLKTLKLINETGETKAEVTSNNGEVLFYRIRSIIANTALYNRLYFLGTRKRENEEIQLHLIALTPQGELVECESIQKKFTTDWNKDEQV